MTVQVGILIVDGIQQSGLATRIMISSLGIIRAKTNDINYIDSSNEQQTLISNITSLAVFQSPSKL